MLYLCTQDVDTRTSTIQCRGSASVIFGHKKTKKLSTR